MFLKPGQFCIDDLSLIWLLIVLQGFCPDLDALQHSGLHDEDTRVDDVPEAAGHHSAGTQYQAGGAIRLWDEVELPDINPLALILVSQDN
jgi:hypothetical protein